MYLGMKLKDTDFGDTGEIVAVTTRTDAQGTRTEYEVVWTQLDGLKDVQVYRHEQVASWLKTGYLTAIGG